MTHPAIKVEGLWKEYTVGAAQQQHGTFYDLLSHSLKAPLRRLRNVGAQAADTERFWALRDLNFEVQPGEVVGVIGRNGAGKSTLLKVLSRITAPTKGRIEVRGRLASLLEVGTGFHPELSGRENIFLNGSILGMSRIEVARKFDEIVAFAEVGKFIDTPVKRYSSGMYVRLAFGVAAHLEPEILIVDEVLAVGDAEFQKRCLGKLKDVATEGRTVLFVSHNMAAIQVLCESAILLDGGAVKSSGPSQLIVDEYLQNIDNGKGVIEKHTGALSLVATSGSYTPLPGSNAEIGIELSLNSTREIADLVIDFGMENKQGLRIIQIVPLARGEHPLRVPKASEIVYRLTVRTTALAPGDYYGTIFVHSRLQGALLHQTNITLLRVPPSENAPECMSSGFTAALVPEYSSKIFVN